MAVDGSGNVYVADRINNRVQKFNAQGECLSQFGSTGSGNGQLNDPRGIAIDKSGNLWVAEAGNQRIQEFTAAGAPTFGRYTILGAPKQPAPSGIAISEGKIYVTDQTRQEIQKYNPTPNSEGKYFVQGWNDLPQSDRPDRAGSGDAGVADDCE
jgi:DNA-binding beta-propeller fold protein YncE